MGDTLSRFEDDGFPPAVEPPNASAHLPPPFSASAAPACQARCTINQVSADAAPDDDDDDMPDLQSRHFRPGEEEGFDEDEDVEEGARDLIAYFEDATAAFATPAAAAAPPGECDLLFCLIFFARALTSCFFHILAAKKNGGVQRKERKGDGRGRME